MKINRQQIVFYAIVGLLIFWAFREGKKYEAEQTKKLQIQKK